MPSRPKAKSTRSLPRDRNPYIVCNSSWNLQTERVWCVIWKLSFISYHFSHVTRYHQNHIMQQTPHSKTPLTLSPMWGICQLPWPMAWQCQLPRLVWGLDHPDTLTFEHNLAAPWLGPGEVGGGWDSKILKGFLHGRDPKTKRKWWHFFFSFSRLWRCFGVFFLLDLFFLGFHAQSLEF